MEPSKRPSRSPSKDAELNQRTQCRGFIELPNELVIEILTYLSALALARVCKVNRRLRVLASEEIPNVTKATAAQINEKLNDALQNPNYRGLDLVKSLRTYLVWNGGMPDVRDYYRHVLYLAGRYEHDNNIQGVSTMYYPNLFEFLLYHNHATHIESDLRYAQQSETVLHDSWIQDLCIRAPHEAFGELHRSVGKALHDTLKREDWQAMLSQVEATPLNKVMLSDSRKAELEEQMWSPVCEASDNTATFAHYYGKSPWTDVEWMLVLAYNCHFLSRLGLPEQLPSEYRYVPTDQGVRLLRRLWGHGVDLKEDDRSVHESYELLQAALCEELRILPVTHLSGRRSLGGRLVDIERRERRGMCASR